MLVVALDCFRLKFNTVVIPQTKPASKLVHHFLVCWCSQALHRNAEFQLKAVEFEVAQQTPPGSSLYFSGSLRTIFLFNSKQDGHPGNELCTSFSGLKLN